MNCIYCKETIPKKRLELLPKTKTCVKCSSTKKVIGQITTSNVGEDIYQELNVIKNNNA